MSTEIFNNEDLNIISSYLHDVKTYRVSFRNCNLLIDNTTESIKRILEREENKNERV